MGKVSFINAGAGSGKTYTLTQKFCEIVSKGAKPSEFILTTYTKAAAAEFRNKLKARLKDEGKKEFLPLVDSAQIGTIHSVAQSYLERYWYLLGMSPSLSIKDNDEMRQFQTRLLDGLVNEEDLDFFYKYTETLGITKYDGNRYAADYDFWKDYVLKLVENLKYYGMEPAKLQEFKGLSMKTVGGIFKEYEFNDATRESLRDLWDSHIQNLRGRSKIAAEANFGEHIEPFLIAPSCEQAFIILTNCTGQWYNNAPEEWHKALKGYICSEHRGLITGFIDKIFAIAEDLHKRIDERKRAEGGLEYSDLEILFRNLLKDESVREEIASSVKFVFVDEFQDVNPIQLEIFQLLRDIVDESFWVGDPKQAIYGFRGSDTSLINAVVNSLLPRDTMSLRTSYRSLPQLVDEANAIFAPAFGTLVGSERVEKERVCLGACERKKNEEKILELYQASHHWWLSVPTKNGESADARNKKNVYPAMASKLRAIFDEKSFKVTDTDSEGNAYERDLRYGDVAILARSNSEVNDIAGVLRQKGIPVSVFDGKLDNQAEVRLVLTLMKYIAGIDERLSFVELRSLLDDASLQDILKSLAEKSVDEGLEKLLKGLRARYARHSVNDMVKELVAVLDLRHLAGKWSYSQSRQSNLESLMAAAAAFQSQGKRASVKEFVDYVSEYEVEGEFDNTGDSVKVMTYHKSKGLQWKMVILASLEHDALKVDEFIKNTLSKVVVWNSGKDDNDVKLIVFPAVGSLVNLIAAELESDNGTKGLYKYLCDKTKAEALRLLYVGYTRAENYVVRLSFGAVPLKWLENTGVGFGNDNRIEICDDEQYVTGNSGKILAMQRPGLADVERKNKFLSPSCIKGDGASVVNECVIDHIAENKDRSRWDVAPERFGSCVHNYMAVHVWCRNNEDVRRRNMESAGRIIDSFGLGDCLSADVLVEQADALYVHIEDSIGRVKDILHEVPFTNRKNGVVVTGEIDLYVTLESGEGILVDFKDPMMRVDNQNDENLSAKASSYRPQLEAYREALEKSHMRVDHIWIYYPMLGAIAK